VGTHFFLGRNKSRNHYDTNSNSITSADINSTSTTNFATNVNTNSDINSDINSALDVCV
jgi:hypothetical protein